MLRPTKAWLIDLASLAWPTGLDLPSLRFRLFVAADTTGCETDVLAEFASSALRRGMVYFCAWGPGCERFHDIVDEVVVEDESGERLFFRPTASDVIMTTWHKNDTLDEALDYFFDLTVPAEGFIAGSDFWLAICVNKPEWASTIRRRIESLSGPK